MSKFALFMKGNKAAKENGFYAATKSLKDENGNPLQWEFRHITSKENDKIRESCMTDIPVAGRPNLYRPKFDTRKYINKLIVESVVVPDLLDAELQDSYGVKKPEDLLYELVDDPGEYTDLTAFIQKFHGFDETLQDKVDEAKN